MFRRILLTAFTSKRYLNSVPCTKLANLDSSSEVSKVQTVQVSLGNQKEIDCYPLSDELVIKKEPRRSVLDTCNAEDIAHVAPHLSPSFNLAAYINKSESLQTLLKLGVNLHKIEKIKDAPQYILGLDFEKDMKECIFFLHGLGLEAEEIANLLTKNPFIFKETTEHLQVRVNYLEYKKFTGEMIQRIIGKNPFWLSHSTQKIDKKLGFIQNQFKLSGSELRVITVMKPKLITYNQRHITKNTFVVKEEMGFSMEEIKKIILKCPAVFMKNQDFILKTFEYVHKKMLIPLETVADAPDILTCRESRLKQRHLFLKKLGKIQFNPKEPNFISISDIIKGDDQYFCTEIAKSSVQAYNMFLKTL